MGTHDLPQKRVHLCKVVSFSRQFWRTIVFRRVILHLRQLSCCPVHFCARKKRALSLFRTHPQAHHLNSRRSLSILDATRGYPGVVRVVATSNPGKLGSPIWAAWGKHPKSYAAWVLTLSPNNSIFIVSAQHFRKALADGDYFFRASLGRSFSIWMGMPIWTLSKFLSWRRSRFVVVITTSQYTQPQASTQVQLQDNFSQHWPTFMVVLMSPISGTKNSGVSCPPWVEVGSISRSPNWSPGLGRSVQLRSSTSSFAFQRSRALASGYRDTPRNGWFFWGKST